MITSPLDQGEGYLIQRGKGEPLGEAFGGYGITSMFVADLAGDGRWELLFAYSFGSGIHRSLIGMWTSEGGATNASPVLRDGDLQLQKLDDHHVDVTYQNIIEPTGQASLSGRFGGLRLSTRAGKPSLDIVLDPKLPKAVSDCIWR